MKRLIALMMLLAATSPLAMAGGVIRPGGTLGPRGTAMSGAQNAAANDVVSAFYHNVGCLTRIKDNSIQVGADLLFPRFDFEPPGRWEDKQESEFSLFPMPLLAGTIRLSDKLVLSGGIYVPYGLGAKYSEGQYQESLLSLTNFTLALSWQVTDTLSIGVGGDVGYSQLVYETALHQIGGVVFDPLFMETKADGFGFSYRAGIWWQPRDWFSLGLSYLSPMKIKLKGDTDLFLFGIGLGDDDFRADVTFPGKIGMGIAIWPTEKWVIALDANWYDHQETDKIDFNFDVLPTIRQELDWQNNWSIHLGTEYQVADNWWLRAGVAWLEPTAPKTTVNPVISDGDGYCLSGGIGWQKGNWSVDIAWLHAWVDEEIERSLNHLAPGSYGVDVDIISWGITWTF